MATRGLALLGVAADYTRPKFPMAMNDTDASDRFVETEGLLREHGTLWWCTWQAAAIDEACQSVPVDALAKHPEVAYWRALAALMRESADALTCLEQAHAGYTAMGNDTGQAVCAHAALVLCLLDIGAMDQVSTWLDRARNARWPDPLGDDTAALWLRLGALARVALGGEALPAAGLAAAWLHAQLRPLRERLSPDERLIAAQVLVNYHFAQQQYEQFDFLATLVESAAPFNAASPLMRGRWLYTVGFAHYQIGGHARAEQAWQQAIALADAHALSNVQLLTSLALVRLLIDRRRLDEAHRVLESMRPQWGAGRTRQLIEWQQMRSRVQLMRGQPALALATLHEALALAQAAGLSLPEQAFVLTDQAQIFAALGRTGEACALLSQLAQDHSGRDAEVYRCLHGLLHAWQHRASDEAASRAALAAALSRAQAVRYTMFLRLLPELAAQLCALALRWQIEPVFVREVIRDRALPAPPDAHAQWPWPLWVHMLGGFALMQDGSPLTQRGKTQHKPLELLKLVACERSQSLGMQAAGRALWPEGEDSSARKNLEMAIQRLRRLLGDDTLVQVRDGHVALDSSRVSSDVAQRRELVARLEALAMQPRGAPDPAGSQRQGDSHAEHEAADLIARIIGLSRGELLPGAPEAAWLMAERQRCQREVVRAAQAAATLMERFGDARAEQELLETALRIEPLAESLASRLMQAHARNGQRADAARVYEGLRAALAPQGLHPSDATERLWREIVGRSRAAG